MMFIFYLGGDDRRVMLWQFGQAILDHGKPEPMRAVHQSNIFCLGITGDQQKIYSGGNDDIVRSFLYFNMVGIVISSYYSMYRDLKCIFE